MSAIIHYRNICVAGGSDHWNQSGISVGKENVIIPMKKKVGQVYFDANSGEFSDSPSFSTCPVNQSGY